MPQDLGVWSRSLSALDIGVKALTSAKHAREIGAVGISAAASGIAWVSDHALISTAAAAGVTGIFCTICGFHYLKRKTQERDAKIAKAFVELQDVYGPFQRKVMALSADLKNGTGNVSSEDIEKAMREHAKYLHQVCKTAQRVFALTRPEVGDFDANIKYIFVPASSSKPEEFCYAPVARASTDHDRLQDDKSIRENPIPLLENIIYRDLVHKNYRKDYYIHADIEARIKEIGIHETVRQPNPDTAPKQYRSMLAHLVGGPSNSLPRSGSGIFSCRGKDVIALMCVDAPVKGVFTDRPGPVLDYQIAIMRQLTDYVFSSYELISLIAGGAPRSSTDENSLLPSGFRYA